MASALEIEIRKKHEIARDGLLNQIAADFVAYASQCARYRVLNELVEFIKERNDALIAGEIEPLDDDI